MGLVGRNGHGKTTLLRILLDREEYDSGNVAIPKGYRIGHVRQQLKFTENTILSEGMLDLPAAEKGPPLEGGENPCRFGVFRQRYATAIPSEFSRRLPGAPQSGPRCLHRNRICSCWTNRRTILISPPFVGSSGSCSAGPMS